MTLPSITSFLLGKQYMGIEHFTLNNEEKTALLLVENKKEGLVITQKDRVTYTPKIADKWDAKLPFFLIVNTNQVIQKEVVGNESSDEKLLHKTFPNTNWDDFYFEIWRLKTKSIVAIARKSYLQGVISNYKEQKITIAGISLGACSISEIIGYTETSDLYTNQQLISTQEENLTITSSIRETTIHYTINDLQIENRHLLAFSGILRLITNGTLNTGSIISYSEELYDAYNQQSFFKKGLKIAVGVVFGILVLNFIFFSHYYKLAQEATETLLINKASVEDVHTIKQRIIVKEEKVKNIVGKTVSQSSLILNEIAKKTPSSILLTELVYNPLEKKIKAEESIVITEKVITISGTTMANSSFTLWIEELEKLKWIDTVLITHFGKKETNETEFSLKLTLK